MTEHPTDVLFQRRLVFIQMTQSYLGRASQIEAIHRQEGSWTAKMAVQMARINWAFTEANAAVLYMEETAIDLYEQTHVRRVMAGRLRDFERDHPIPPGYEDSRLMDVTFPTDEEWTNPLWQIIPRE